MKSRPFEGSRTEQGFDLSGATAKEGQEWIMTSPKKTFALK